MSAKHEAACGCAHCTRESVVRAALALERATRTKNLDLPSSLVVYDLLVAVRDYRRALSRMRRARPAWLNVATEAEAREQRRRCRR